MPVQYTCRACLICHTAVAADRPTTNTYKASRKVTWTVRQSCPSLLQHAAPGTATESVHYIQHCRIPTFSAWCHSPNVMIIRNANTAPFHRYGTTSCHCGGNMRSFNPSSCRLNIMLTRRMQDTHWEIVADKAAPQTPQLRPTKQQQ